MTVARGAGVVARPEEVAGQRRVLERDLEDLRRPRHQPSRAAERPRLPGVARHLPLVGRRTHQHGAGGAVVGARAQVCEARGLALTRLFRSLAERSDPIGQLEPGGEPAAEVALVDPGGGGQAFAHVGAAVGSRPDRSQELGIEELVLEGKTRHRSDSMSHHGTYMPQPRLRFAPSPTGPLHLGSAVVAVANALGARSLGGELLLRIDDTDAERTAEGAEQGILDDLAWLGLELSGTPVRQSARSGEHLAAAQQLLATALAYRCFCPPSQDRYDGRCRALPRADAERRHDAGEANVVRFRVPVGRGRGRRRDAGARPLRRG